MVCICTALSLKLQSMYVSNNFIPPFAEEYTPYMFYKTTYNGITLQEWNK